MRTLLFALLLAGEFAAWAYVSVPHASPSVTDRTVALALATSTKKSLNWSGYVASDGGTFSAVYGSWIVPKVSTGDTLAADATWVGIGGVDSDQLIQAGTQAVALEDGYIEYQAWVEGLPGDSVPVPLDVRAGDTVSVRLEETSPDFWRITIHNDTTGKNYTLETHYRAARTSAEWIEEVPSGSEILALDNFDTVHFLEASALEDGKTVTPAQASALALSMVTYDGNTIALPSVLDARGSAFRVTRLP